MAVTRNEAENYRRDPDNWRFGFIYRCSGDPRIIVRNRGTIGWTWNFGHARSYLYIGATVALFVAIYYLFAIVMGRVAMAAAVAAVAFAGLLATAHRSASGP